MQCVVLGHIFHLLFPAATEGFLQEMVEGVHFFLLYSYADHLSHAEGTAMHWQEGYLR